MVSGQPFEVSVADKSGLVCREFSWDLVEIFSEAIVRHYTLSVKITCTALHAACSCACSWTYKLHALITDAF